MAQTNNYGTVLQGPERATAHNNGASDAAGFESSPASALLGGKQDRETTLAQRFRNHMGARVSRSWSDVALLACYPITGLLDSSSVFVWGSFLGMQTGNTIYLGLGLVAPTESDRWIRSLISIFSFCLGSLVFAAYHRWLGGRKRWVLVSSITVQLLLIAAAALMVTLGPQQDSKDPITVWVGVPVALVAFQSAGQASMSRSLQFGTLTSVVLTSIYLDLFSDPQLFSMPMANIERNRRAAAPVLLLIGAMAGGAWAHSEIGVAGALWTAVGLKALIIVAWCAWAAEKEEEGAA